MDETPANVATSKVISVSFDSCKSYTRYWRGWQHKDL